MITLLPESKGPVLGFTVTGKVTLDEENAWIKKIEQELESYDKVSVLVVLGEEASWGVEAGIKDLKWVMIHLKRLHRIAIVSDSKVWKWLVTLDSPFAKLVGINEKHFEHARIEEAWKWVKDAG